MITHYPCITYKKNILEIRTIIFICFFLLLGTSSANGSPPIHGTFLPVRGTEIVLVLTINGPVPANVIVDQHIHPANRVINTIPKARKVTSQQGVVKWLFRNVKNGKITITTRLDAPLRGPIKAVVRYHDPHSGNFVELQIHP